MALWQGKSKRRSTGGRISPHRGKKRSEIGREIRKAFITSNKKENVLVSFDYSQIELRVLAHLSKDETLIQSFIDGRELTVSILDGETLPIVEIVPKGDYYDYKSKYTKFQSDYIAPANINKKTQELLSLYS